MLYFIFYYLIKVLIIKNQFMNKLQDLIINNFAFLFGQLCEIIIYINYNLYIT